MRYFDTARTEIQPYLPDRCARVLDIGCGTGATTDWIRTERSVEWAGGVELDPDAAEQAGSKLDQLWTGMIEDADLEVGIQQGSLDLVLCLDVLEHLVDPWAVVQRVSPLLAPGGRLIVSVPNIRNWKFIWRLMMKGDFHYTDAGLLDRTHLRFFVRSTAEALAISGGLSLQGSYDANIYGSWEFRRMLIAATGGRLAPLIAKQWIVVAEADNDA